VKTHHSPEDVGGMWTSQGILMSRGGVTRHAAVVARGWGKPCVCGCNEFEIDSEVNTMMVKSTGEIFKEGDVISLNGSTGEVIRGAIQKTEASLDGNFDMLLSWADEVEDACTVMANADFGPDSARAIELGAKGIGLTRSDVTHVGLQPHRVRSASLRMFSRSWSLSISPSMKRRRR